MAIQKRFIHFKKFSDFNSKKLSANEANTQYTIGVSGEVQTGAPDILYQSYCWIKDTKQQWTHGQLYDCNPNDDAISSVYITNFDVLSLYNLAQNPDEVGGIQSDNRAITNALAANKIVLVPYEISDNPSCRGYATLVGYVEDLLYFKVITENYEIIVETNFSAANIFGQEVTLRDWGNKQDQLISGANIKTINGQSLLGSGDIVIEGGEDIRYFTEFTVEQVMAAGSMLMLPQQTSELYAAAENNKLICIPCQDGLNGFIVASYEVTLDEHLYVSFIYEATYYRMLALPRALDISIHPLSTQTVFVDSGGIDVYDNHNYVVTTPVTSLMITIPTQLNVGSLIRFIAGDNCVFRFVGVGDILWANDVLPTIESGVTYELSLVKTQLNANTYTLAVLTPFKPVE